MIEALPGNRLIQFIRKDRQFYVGTLRYTTFGLMMIFIWVLWGDFVWSIMDQNVPGIIPLKLTDLHATDTLNQVLNGSFAFAIIFTLAPVVSVASDRHRGRFGRRFPYLFWSTPFVGLCLVLIGCYDNVVNLIMHKSDHLMLFGHWEISRTSVTLFVFGALYVGYDFANIFVSTVYYYLFNDVVPSHLISRFMSLFRIAGTFAGIGYNAYVLPHAMTHFKIIFVIAGISYVVGFMLMCIFVRESQYPPPEAVPTGSPGYWAKFAAVAKKCAKECFTHRLYWFFFISNAFSLVSYRAGRLQMQRDTLSLGLSLDEIGRIGVWTLWISLFLQYPAGWLSDKFGPLQVYIVTRWIQAGGILVQLVWIVKDFGHDGNLVLMWWINLVFLPFNLLSDAAEMPMYMRLLPRDRYGQFCSANAMLRAGAGIFGSYLSGVFLDFFARREHFQYWHYRLIPIWTTVFQIPSLIFLVLLYIAWKKRGGHHGYTPP